jgi:hypothetical protein
MTAGHPPSPTYRSIALGLVLSAAVLVGLLRIGLFAKSIGAIFMFVPAKLGLIEMAYPADVIEVDIRRSPSSAILDAPGPYLLYTDNLDLLLINDAVVESDAAVWIKAVTQSGARCQWS